jgi:predicted transport protein
MPIYKIKNDNLEYIDEKKIDLEKNIQILTEKNLQKIFNLKFISGASNQEFGIRVNEQDFFIDTLAIDEEQKSFVIIEYKKDKSISVVDQGFAYLSAMLRSKAEFILEINRRLGKNFQKEDINWDQSKVYFISPEFTNYQTNAVNFKDLPISLYEVKLYNDNLISYSPIKPNKTSESITKMVKDEVIQQVSKEIKVYDKNDLVKTKWLETNELLEAFEKELISRIPETEIKYTKFYIAYMSKYGRNYVEVIPQSKGVKIYYRFTVNDVKTYLKIEDCSKIGRLPNGKSFFLLEKSDDISEAARLGQESYKYWHK